MALLLQSNKFDRKNDYCLWKMKIKAILIEKGCAAVLEKPDPKSKGKAHVLDEKAQAKLAEMQLKAYGAVILNLGDKVLREIQEQKTAAEILERIIAVEVEAEDSVDLVAMEAVVTDVVKALMDEMTEILKVVRQKVPIQDRITKMKFVKNCFSGAELVEELIHQLDCDRKKAVEIGKQLARRHLIHHIFGENEFEDGNHFYRFLEQRGGK